MNKLPAVLTTFLLFFCATTLAACEHQGAAGSVSDMSELSAQLPGDSILDIAPDSEGSIFFVTQGLDSTTQVPIWSSALPTRYYLTRYDADKDTIEIVDDHFKEASKVLFDEEGGLWIMTADMVFKRTGTTDKPVLQIPKESGRFTYMALDREGNIWACGLQTGLFKIEPGLTVTSFTTSNSKLSTNSMTSIHIDGENSVWVALWDNKGILKIAGDTWTIYSSDNSDITSQNVWSLSSDNDGNLWIGSGWSDGGVALMRFDRAHWVVENPKDNNGQEISGTVRKLVSYGKMILVVSDTDRDMAFDKNYVSTYDGSKWKRIYEIPDDDPVADVEVDSVGRSVWIGSINKSLYKVRL